MILWGNASSENERCFSLCFSVNSSNFQRFMRHHLFTVDEECVQQNTLAQRQQCDREDADLLRRIQRADQRALATLYDRYAPVLYPFGLRMTGSHEVAEDVVHDVFIHVWEKGNSYAPRNGSVYAWLTALCRVKALEKMRTTNQKKKGSNGEGSPPHSVLESEEKQGGQETILTFKGYTEEVRDLLKNLSKLELRLLELSYYESQSQSDLARMLRIPLGTIKAKMRRGIQKLRQAPSQEAKRP
jgi:RNA polymerase sigma-70 factor (ECF subfamily)